MAMCVAKRFGVVLVLVAICGCGSGNPSTAEVTATVTYNGSPVDGASVVFASALPGGRTASGLTDSAGKVSLTTFEKGDGAIPGSYTVAITKVSGGGSGMSAEDEHAAIEAGKEVPKAAAPKAVLPAKYADGTTSGLTADVTAAGPNNFTFELVDEGSAPK